MVQRLWKQIATAAAGLFLIAAAQPVRAQETSAREQVKETLQAMPRVPFEAHLRLTTDLGELRELDLKHKFVNGARSTYLEVVAPESIRGIRFLFIEHTDRPADQYMKVTAARTSVRVADHVRKRPFLGSTFYIADMVEPDINAYDYAFVGEQKVLDRDCTLIEAVPKNKKDELYGKVVFAVDPNDHLVLRRNFFDHDGEVLKVWTVEKLEKIDGFWTMLEQRMRNVQQKTESTLEITTVKYNVDIEDIVFTPKYLLR